MRGGPTFTGISSVKLTSRNKRWFGSKQKNINRMVKDMMLAFVLLLLSAPLPAQDGSLRRIDKKVARIEAYAFYDVIKIDEPADLKRINRNLVELTNYSRHKDDQGKIEEKLATGDGHCYRTTYFDRYRNVVFIRERLVTPDKTTHRRYYFDNNALLKVVDNHDHDRTAEVDMVALRQRIKGYWGIDIQ
jgi:hypothetical protein